MNASPMEELFWQEWQRWVGCVFGSADIDGILPLVRQHPVGRYRVDFALPAIKLAIEIDGFDYHSNREHLINDRRRQREIEAEGWRVVRFAGSEVYRDAEGCALDVMTIVQRMPATPEITERRKRFHAELLAELLADLADLGLTEADIDRS